MSNIGQASQIIFSSKIISLQAVTQVISIYHHFYKFTISECETNYLVQIEDIGLAEVDDVFCEKFKKEVLDQQIRVDLQKEFGSLRDTIVKYAFFPAEENIENE